MPASRRAANLIGIGDRRPSLSTQAWVDPSALIIGSVEVGADVGIWPGAIVRGDDAEVILGRGCMILENCVIEAPRGRPVIVEEEAIISHGAIVHGATIRRRALIGIGAIVLDGAVVGEEAVVGAGAVVPPGMNIPARKLVLGVPGKVVREVTEADLKALAEERRSLLEKKAVYRSIR